MFDYKIKDSDREYFFEDLERRFPRKILFYMIASLSFYFIYWIYKTNQDFLILEEKYDLPDPKRAISVLVILPAIWFLMTYFVKKFIFNINDNFLLRIYLDTSVEYYKSSIQVLGYIELGVWIFLLFLILKYFYDFCRFFGDLTKSNFFIWYLFLSSQAFAFIFLLLGQYGLFSLIFFNLMCIPAMQAKLNSLIERSEMQQRKNNYYHVLRK